MHVLHRMRDASRLCFAELLLGCESLTSRLDVAVFHHWNFVHVSPSAPALLKLLGADERHCKGNEAVCKENRAQHPATHSATRAVVVPVGDYHITTVHRDMCDQNDRNEYAGLGDETNLIATSIRVVRCRRLSRTDRPLNAGLPACLGSCDESQSHHTCGFGTHRVRGLSICGLLLCQIFAWSSCSLSAELPEWAVNDMPRSELSHSVVSQVNCLDCRKRSGVRHDCISSRAWCCLRLATRDS